MVANAAVSVSTGAGILITKTQGVGMAVYAMQGAVSMGAGIVIGKLAGASWLSSSIFMVTDLAVGSSTFYLMDVTMPAQSLLIKVLVASILGSSAGFYLSRYLLGRANSLHWAQAAAAHLAALFVLAMINMELEMKPSSTTLIQIGKV